MAEQNTGKITQIIGAVMDIKFSQGKIPEINEAIRWKPAVSWLLRLPRILVTIRSDVSLWEQPTD